MNLAELYDLRTQEVKDLRVVINKLMNENNKLRNELKEARESR